MESVIVPDIVVRLASLCQLSVSAIVLFAYVPQWIKLVRSKSSNDISVHSWFLWLLSSVFANFYAIVQLLLNGRGWPLVISALTSLMAILGTIFLTVRYRRR